jgi:hypothetical protein
MSISNDDPHTTMFIKPYLLYIYYILRDEYGLVPHFSKDALVVINARPLDERFLTLNDAPILYKFYPLNDIDKIYKSLISKYRICPLCYKSLRENSECSAPMCNKYILKGETYICDPDINAKIKPNKFSPMKVDPYSSKHPGKKSAFYKYEATFKSTDYYFISPEYITFNILTANPHFKDLLEKYITNEQCRFSLFTDAHIIKIQDLLTTEFRNIANGITNIYLYLKYNGLISSAEALITGGKKLIQTIGERQFIIKTLKEYTDTGKTLTHVKNKYISGDLIKLADELCSPETNKLIEDYIIKINNCWDILYIPYQEILKLKQPKIRAKLIQLHDELIQKGYLETYASTTSQTIVTHSIILYKNGLYFDNSNINAKSIIGRMNFNEKYLFIHPQDLTIENLKTAKLQYDNLKTLESLAKYIFIYASPEIEGIKVNHKTLLDHLHETCGLLVELNIDEIYKYISACPGKILRAVKEERIPILPYPTTSLAQLKILFNDKYSVYSSCINMNNLLNIYLYNIFINSKGDNILMNQDKLSIVYDNIYNNKFNYFNLTSEAFLKIPSDLLEYRCLYMLIGNFLHSIGFNKSGNIRPIQQYDINIDLYPISNEDYLVTPIEIIYMMVLNENYYWFKYIKITNENILSNVKKPIPSMAIAKMAQIIYHARRINYKIPQVYQEHVITYNIREEYFDIKINSTYPLHKLAMERIKLLERIISAYDPSKDLDDYIKNTLSNYALESYLFLKPNKNDVQYTTALSMLQQYGIYELVDENDQSRLIDNNLTLNRFYEGVSIKNYLNYINNKTYRNLLYDIKIYSEKGLLFDVFVIATLFVYININKNNQLYDYHMKHINNAIINNDRAMFWRIEQYMLPFIDSPNIGPILQYLDTIRYQIDPSINNFPIYEKIPKVSIDTNIVSALDLYLTMMSILHINTIRQRFSDNIDQVVNPFDIANINAYKQQYQRSIFHYVYNLIHEDKLTIDVNFNIVQRDRLKGGTVMFNIEQLSFFESLTKFINLNIFRRK